MEGLNSLDEHSQVERLYHCPPDHRSPTDRPWWAKGSPWGQQEEISGLSYVCVGL